MNGDYVSLKTAVMLHKKGYNYGGETFYMANGTILAPREQEEETQTVRVEGGILEVRVPTLYMAQKWLRKRHCIHVSVCALEKMYFPTLHKTNGTHIKSLVAEGPNDDMEWDSYEEALEAGIIEALKLI